MISLCTTICTHHKPQKGALSPGHHRLGGQWVARDIAGCPGEESRWRLRGRRWSGKRRCASSKTNIRLEQTGSFSGWKAAWKIGTELRTTRPPRVMTVGLARRFQTLVIFSTRSSLGIWHSSLRQLVTLVGYGCVPVKFEKVERKLRSYPKTGGRMKML